MDSCCPLDVSHRDSFVIGDASQGVANVMAAGRPQFKTNFSYPRPDGLPTRHEATDSRSSLNSSSSVPCMTDASDSEASGDDDYHYNTSASELWDSFWPTGLEREEQPARKPLDPGVPQLPMGDFFSVDYSASQSDESEDDTITITQPDNELRDSISSQWPLSRPPSTGSPPRATPAGSSVTYSVYPKPRPTPLPNLGALPPRISSLTPDTSPSFAGRFLKGSKSIANLKSARSIANLHLAPSALSPSSYKVIKESRSLPVSPTSPIPHLRSSASAFSLREISQHNATAPLTPMLPVTPIIPCIPLEHVKTCRSQSEPFVSVFDHDSDNESDSEPQQRGFARRIARGLRSNREIGHKKSASEKRSNKKPPTTPTAAESSPSEGMGRRRGGSLGWILGLKSKS